MLNCDKVDLIEQNRLQSFAYVLLIDKEYHIHLCSSNLKDWAMREATTMIGMSLFELFHEQTKHVLKAWLDSPDKRYYQPILDWRQNKVWLRKQKIDHCCLIELEPERQPPYIHDFSDALETMNERLEANKGPYALQQLTKMLAEWTFEQLQFDAVRVYQFNEDQSGTVIVEQKRPEVDSYEQFRFPAYEVPKPVRQFFKRHLYRYIPAVHAPETMLVSESPKRNQVLLLVDAKPIANIHKKYLRNMKVQSAFSIPIMVKNKLWGLLACQHREEKFIHPQDRFYCYQMVDYISVKMALLIETVRKKEKENLLNIYETMKQKLAKKTSIAEALEEDFIDLREHIEACGYAFFIENHWHIYGKAPSKVELNALQIWLNENMQETLFYCHNLPAKYAEAKHFSLPTYGILAIRLTDSTQNYFIFFRQEHVQTITWGGNPDEIREQGMKKKPYSPRNSFSAWIETISGQSKPWTENNLDYAKMINRLLRDKWLQQILHEKAFIDPLTKVYNRYYLEKWQEEVKQDRRKNQTSICLAMMDIDNFKKLNDEYGHPFGDKVLALTAQIIQNKLRSTDIVCRYGGEEFLTVLFSCTKENCAEIMETVLAAVRAEAFCTENQNQLNITISIGYTMGKLQKKTVPDLIKQADKALYQAKNSGKNRICFYTD